MDVSLTAWGVALLGVLACAGCDHAPPMALPRCLDGQGLATDAAGNFQCTALQPTALSIRAPVRGCADGQVLTYVENTVQLTCSDKVVPSDSAVRGDVLRAQLAALEQNLAGLTQTVAQLQTILPSTEPLYVGSTHPPAPTSTT